MKRLTMRLDTKSIKNAIKELEEYKMSIRKKNELFVSRLIDEGIKIAQRNVGYGKYISVTKELENDGARTIGFLIAKDTKKIHAEWDYYGQKKTAELSPLLLAEFGSATLAEVLFDISGVGQGTFPGQKHAGETMWWYKEWKDDHTGEWRQGFGVTPTHPMYMADMEMLQRLEEIAREVFANGI